LLSEPEEARRPRHLSFAVLGVSAAVAAAIAIAVLLSPEWKVDTTDNRLAFGQRVQSGLKTNTFTLEDGSRLEVNTNSDVGLEKAKDGVLIRLYSGSVIVNAAPQLQGHLYVQTADIKVAVTGTVFLVNAERNGSRVAVIDGEVHVEHGSVARKLRYGDQITTGVTMLPVTEEIAWSMQAPVHLALLQKNTASPARLQFAVTSIKPTTPGPPMISGESWGFACHGIDGEWRSINERLPEGGSPIVAPRGMCVGNGVRTADLIASAYEIAQRFVINAPDWASGIRSEGFSIEAAAEQRSTATLSQLKEMLRTLLADRFKLKVHRDTQEAEGYALTVAKGGLKLKETTDAKQLPASVRNDLGQPIIKGKSTLDELAQYLTQFVGLPVSNMTALSGVYEYEFSSAVPNTGGRGAGDGIPRNPSSALSDRAEAIVGAISPVMENRLGLRLHAEKVPYEVLVVDEVERPSPN
jgi:uncharacterized protein (TIGR03435 family)